VEQTTSPGRSFFRGWRLWLLLAVVAYTLIGFFVLPWIIERQIEKFGQNRLERSLTVEQIRFNPYSLSLAVEGLKLDEADGAPIAALDRFFVNFQASSLFRRAWTFREISLAGPYVNFIRFEDGGNNFQRLLQTLSATAPAESTPATGTPDDGGLPRLLLMHFVLQAGTVDFTDLTPETDFRTRFDGIDLELFALNTAPQKEAEHSFDLVTETGAQITWTGRLQANPTRLVGRLDAVGERPRLIWRYIQDDVDFEIADGQVTLGLNLEVAMSDGQPSVAVDNIEYTLTDLLLRPKGVEQDVLRVPRLTLTGGQIRYPEKTFHLDEARIEGARLLAFRDEEGVFNIVDLLEADDGSPAPGEGNNEPAVGEEDLGSASAGEQASAEQGTEPSTVPDLEEMPAEEDTDEGNSGWLFTLGSLVVGDFGAEFEDRSFSRPVQSGLESTNLTVSDFSSEPGATFSFELDTAITSGGRVGASGGVTLEPRNADVAMEIEALSLEPLEPLIGRYTRLRLLSGDVTVTGRLTHDPDETLRFSGASRIDRLVTEDTLLDERFVAWKSLSMPSVEYAMDGGTLAIDTVDFDAPYAKLTIKEDGTTNLADVFPAEESAGTGAEESPISDDESSGTGRPPLKIDIRSITVKEGSANFGDMSLPLPFATAIHSMQGDIQNISSYKGEPATVDIAGVVDESGSADIGGELDPFAPVDFLKMDVVFKNVHMPRLTPYSAKFAGREIESGKLSLDLKYRIEKGQLDSTNKIIIDRIVLGDRVDSPEAMNLPMDLAVALLQDSEGRINLELPVKGDLNSPEFQYGSVVWKAFVGILTKAVTAPFKLLGALIPGGGEGEQLEFIQFEPGSAELSAAEVADLDTIAEAMAKRPQLMLTVPNAYSATTDKTALQAAKLDRQVEERLPDIKAKDGLDPERLALEQIYREHFSGTELDNLRAANTRAEEAGREATLNEEAYVESLIRSLENNQVVATSELEALGAERAAAITEYLVSTAGAPAERISQGEVTTVEPDADGKVPLQFQVDTDGA
jgi:hypothetical protein